MSEQPTSPDSMNASLRNGVWINQWLAQWLLAHVTNPSRTGADVKIHTDGSTSVELLDVEGKASGGTLYFNPRAALHVLNGADGASYKHHELLAAAEVAAKREASKRSEMQYEAAWTLGATIGFIVGVATCVVILATRH